MNKMVFSLFLFLAAHNAFSAYLNNMPVSLTQPDGTVINCFVTGDEFHRRVHDSNNYTIIHDPSTGFYVYAQLINSRLVPSSAIVGQTAPEKLSLQPGYDIPPSEMELKRSNALKSAARMATTHTKGDFNNIVINIRFADQEPAGINTDFYNAKFNSLQNVSLRYYFNEVSNGQLNVSTYFFPAPDRNTITEYQDDHPRGYYSPYNMSNPDGYQGSQGSQREMALYRKAIDFVKNQVVASGVNFDVNNDGVTDNVIFLMQGSPDGWGDVLWPAAGNLFYQNIFIGGNRVGRYNRQFTGWLDVGVLCHEFFHSLGAPDLYRYTHTQIDPVGAWDLMASNQTQHMTTFMKWKYGKWFDEVPEITTAGTYTLRPVSQDPFACYKIASPKNTDEYFMVEYRKKEGMLDTTTPWSYEEGLIIYRINTKTSGGNASGPPDEVYVYRPDGTSEYSGQIYSAPFSSDNFRTVFNNETNPAPLLSNGDPGWIDISDVSGAGNEISFTVNEISLPKPENFMASAVNGEILFTWKEPSFAGFAPLGYNIWLMDEPTPLNASLITRTSFSIPFSGPEPFYAFQIAANYPEGWSAMATTAVAAPGNLFGKDSLALVAVYNQCNGPNWSNNTNWLEGPLHSWYGVTVENNRVTALDLSGTWNKPFGMTKNLPPQIGSLGDLEVLNLSSNQLTGVPDEIGRLKNLALLDFSDNKLSVITDSVWQLASLKELSLGSNQIAGELSPNIAGLVNLESLSLGWNQFYGPVPSEISRLNQLESLSLSGNNFSGEIFSYLSHLTNIVSLGLAINAFSDIVPPEIGRLKKLEYLDLSENQFYDELPVEFGELTNLRSVNLSNNRFQGAIPRNFGKITTLGWINFSYNNFDAIPALLHSPHLEGIELHWNKFTFEDIEPNLNLGANIKGFYMSYDEQQKIGKEETKYAPPGKPHVLSVYCGGSRNRYQWYKNGIAVSEPSESPELVVENVTAGINGVYHCRITGSSRLELESHPVTLVGSNELTADAGHDFAVDGGSLVTLDGSASFHSGNSALKYKWYAPHDIQLSGADAAQPRFTAPVVDLDREYIFSLYVNDGTRESISDEVSVTVRGTGRDAPVANAGDDQIVSEGDLVTLSGWRSRGYGGLSSYIWTAPDGIEMLVFNIAEPEFIAPEVTSDTAFIFSLVVYDGYEYSNTDEMAVTVLDRYNSPVADAGPDLTVTEGEQVILDGSGSYSYGGEHTWSWTAPDGIVLSAADSEMPEFTAPEVDADAVFIFSLVINDGSEDSAPDEVAVTLLNLPNPPVANAGPDLTVFSGELVMLDGSGSAGTETDTLYYNWLAPEGITLDDPVNPRPSFIAPEFDADTTLTFYLVVTNRDNLSDTSGVSITIKPQVTAAMHPAGSGKLLIYPNPSDGMVNLRLPDAGTAAPFIVVVTTASGAVILQKQPGSSDGVTSLDLSGHPAGTYYIYIKHGHGKYYEKIILQ